MRGGLILILLVASSGPAFAEDARTGRARQEIEKQLKEMVKPSPASVEIVFDGIDSTRYQLLEASFDLDGESLTKKVPTGKAAGSTVLFTGDLPPGSHTVTARLVYEQAAAAGMFSYGSGTKFKVPGKFIFTAQRGLFVRVHTRVEVDDGAELQKRLQLAGNVDVDLRAKLEDGTLPPAPESLVQMQTAPKKTKPSRRNSRAKLEPLSTGERPSGKRQRSEGKVKFAAAGADDTARVKQAAYLDSATASAPGPISADAGPGAGSDAGAEPVDAGAPALDAGTATVAERPPPSAPPPPQRANQEFTATDLAVGIGAIALVAILVFALTRRRG